MAKSLSKLSDCGENETALTSILNDWKDHLQEQKKELEDYYKRCVLYRTLMISIIRMFHSFESY